MSDQTEPMKSGFLEQDGTAAFVVANDSSLCKAGFAQECEITNQGENTRSMRVIEPADHMKSTLTNSLIGKTSFISDEQVDDTRFNDTMTDELERGVIIWSTGVSLVFEHDSDNDVSPKSHLTNFIDSSGYVGFSSEIAVDLRITDVAMTICRLHRGLCRADQNHA